jgi:hypothetical protein
LPIPTATGDLYNYLTAEVVAYMPGSGEGVYVEPTANAKAEFKTIINNIYNHNYSAARAAALTINYDLTYFTDIYNSLSYYILRENTPISQGWGTYIFNPRLFKAGTASSNTIEITVAAPHPLSDTNTERIALELFRQGNRTNTLRQTVAYMLAGTHRYCTYQGGEWISDVAHNANSIFQAVHEEIMALTIEEVIQIHGFSATAHPGYPSIVLSNGTPSYPSQFTNLKAVFESPTYSIDTGIYDGTTWEALGATTNVQAISAEGKAVFYHTEITNALRIPYPSANSTKLINALLQYWE